MKWLWRNKFWVILILVVSTASYFRNRLAPAPRSSLKVTAVERGEFIQRVTIIGQVTPNRKTIISAPYSGYVRKIFVRVGDRVAAGDPVISLAQSLKPSDEDVFPLRAPFDGTVVQVLRTEGEYVEAQSSSQASNSMVRIDDVSRIFVEAPSPEVEVGKLKVGQKVIIKASAIPQRTYNGVIRRISLAAKEQKDWDRARVEFPILLEVVDADVALKPGMSVIVDVITKRVPKSLILRHEYLQREGDNYFVILESGEKKAIKVGAQNEEAFEILGGVDEGERVRQNDFLSAQ